MELLGYGSLVFMGLTLGLIGAGGSILTIPILVYMFKIPIVLATSYSQIIVGGSAFVGAVRYKRSILFRKALLLSIPSMIGVYISRVYVVSALPESIGAFSRDQLFFVILIGFMISASYLMLKDDNFRVTQEQKITRLNQMRVVVISFFMGIVMGLLGAGGGFLIIPTLVLLMGMTMHEAVPTSLFIITINALIGSLSDQAQLGRDDWYSLLYFLSLALCGMAVGIWIGKSMRPSKLKKGFGWFVFFVAVMIIMREFFY